MLDNGTGIEKYAKGTRFTISSHPTKAANGTFEITTLFGLQREGKEYYTYRRVMADGSVSKSTATNNLRGGWNTFLDKWAAII